MELSTLISLSTCDQHIGVGYNSECVFCVKLYFINLLQYDYIPMSLYTSTLNAYVTADRAATNMALEIDKLKEELALVKDLSAQRGLYIIKSKQRELSHDT